MVGSALHYIFDLEACELHLCTMRLYCKHTLIYWKLTGSQIRVLVFFIIMLEQFSSMCSCGCQNMVKKALSQVCVNPSSGHFFFS